jgi:hypothetical protein
MLLSYIDLRPLLFAGGLLVFVLLAVVISRLVRVKTHPAWVATLAGLAFTVLFIFFLTEYGPFLGIKQTRMVQMRWEIKPGLHEGLKEPEVVLHFQDYPGCSVGEHSRELAEHLRVGSAALIQAKMEVTYDYGRPRGFRMTEIDGLREWKSERGYSASSGSPKRAPWD